MLSLQRMQNASEEKLPKLYELQESIPPNMWQIERNKLELDSRFQIHMLELS